MSLRTLRNRALISQSKYILKRDPVCVSCGLGPSVQAGHYYHGDGMDFIIPNMNGQCIECNQFNNGNSNGYENYLINKFGPSIIEQLKIAKGVIRKYTKDELIEIKEYYEQCRKELEG